MFVLRQEFLFSRSVIKRLTLCLTAIASVCLLALSSLAQTQLYEQAVQEYKNQNFKQAAQLFNQYLTSQIQTNQSLFTHSASPNENPTIAYSIFYEAICLEKIGDFEDATTLHELVIRRYTGTKLAAESQKLQKGLLQHLRSSRPRTQTILPPRDKSLDFFPKETWIPFTRYGNLMLVEGSINKHKTGMLFDTGAAGCLFSTAQLKALEITIPAGSPTASVAGVGTQKQTPAWTIPVDLTLGSIQRRQFPVQVNDNPLNFPLLGVNFFEGLEYTIDNQANTIQFKSMARENEEHRSSSPAYSTLASGSKMFTTVDSSSHYVYNVPFTELNRAIIVTAKIAGQDCSMILDTGTDICLFTSSQLKADNIIPKYTGRTLTCKGAAGTMKAPVCLFDTAEFGPIRGPMTCIVTDDAALPMPLLGQNFLKGWQITIDHTSHLVKLIRK